MKLAAPALILIGALALAGCGRRGPLEEPPRARAQAGNQQASAGPTSTGQTAPGVVLGSPSFGPGRQTATTDNTEEGFGTPAMALPGLPPANMATATDPNAVNPAAPQTISSSTTSTGQRSGRRSPPPDRAFLLDPLL